MIISNNQASFRPPGLEGCHYEHGPSTACKIHPDCTVRPAQTRRHRLVLSALRRRFLAEYSDRPGMDGRSIPSFVTSQLPIPANGFAIGGMQGRGIAAGDLGGVDVVSSSSPGFI